MDQIRKTGRTTSDLSLELLEQEGPHFHFDNLMTLLRRHHPESADIGMASHPKEEFFEFHNNFSTAFPAGDVAGVTRSKSGRYEIDMNLLSIGGAFGPLPPSDSFFVQEQKRKKNRAPLGFFNTLVHRLMAQLYRVSRFYRLAQKYPDSEEEVISRCMRACIGRREIGRLPPKPMSPHFYSCFCGLLNRRTKTPWVLERLLFLYYGFNVSVVSVTGSRFPLKQDQQSRIGTGKACNNRIGDNLVLGTTVYVDQCRFEIAFSNLDADMYHQFLPGGKDHKSLTDLIRMFIGSTESSDLLLEIPMNRLPKPKLKRKNPPRLGWNFVLKSARNKSTKIVRTRIPCRWNQPKTASSI